MYMSYTLPDRKNRLANQVFPVLAGLLTFLVMAGCASTKTQALPADAAANQMQVSPGVYLSGELNKDRITDLAASDALVVDLRTQPEGTAVEADELIKAGVGYVNLPIAGASIDPAAVASLASLLKSRGGAPVLLHCRSGNRAGMLYAAYLIDSGVSVDDALLAVGDVITVDAISDAVRSYAQGE